MIQTLKNRFIGDKAFYGCGNLKVRLPENVRIIGDEAFRKCRIGLADRLKLIGSSMKK